MAGFGGTPGRITPPIAPRDSFVARFTPPRAGTFIYHTHIDERRQEPAGLSGVIVVLEPGARFDPATDHPILLTTPRRRLDRGRAYLNGSLTPPALEWRAGERHRLRLVNMTIAPPSGLTVALVRDSSIVSWRPVAKDGADLPPSIAVAQRAPVRITIGETHDFEVIPDEPGEYRLEARLAANPSVLRAVLPVRVR